MLGKLQAAGGPAADADLGIAGHEKQGARERRVRRWLERTEARHGRWPSAAASSMAG